jgi:hypothetical protein
MGLAGPDEVDPVLWIENTVPPLGARYHPYGVRTVRGTKREVRIQDVIAAEGPRNPAYPAQRRFTIAFVLLVDPSKPVAEKETAAVARARDTLIKDFKRATGGRGEVVALPFEPRSSRRRTVRH